MNAAVPSNAILSRVETLRERLGLTRAAFARRLGMDPSNLSRIMTGATPPTERFIDRIVARLDVPRPWLLEGEGDENAAPMLPAASGAAAIYDIDVMAGTAELSREFTRENCIGFISMPGLDPACPLVRVSGDSMAPAVPPGAYLSIRRVAVGRPLFWGHAYVVVLDDYRLVKYVRRHPGDDSLIVLHSANPEYDDMTVALADVRALFLVETVVHIDRRI